ncbi:MAG: hypothetical protein ABJB03_00755 [Rhodoglobus sp.]
MYKSIAPFALLAVASAALLTGCASGPATDTAEHFATSTEDTLEQSVGSRPVVDCGTDPIELVDGTVVTCVLTDPSTGTQYDTSVTISEVKGSDYHIDVKVADSPKE